MDVDEPHLSPEAIQALAHRIDRPVVLVGMMGTGKTSVGRKLAAALQCPFIDADDAIEEAAAMSIPEIFASHGEAYFRDGERRVIARLIKDEGPQKLGPLKVIATGGGAFCNDQTRALILDKGIAVWLDSDIETLLERTSRKENRPLLQGGDRREILTRLRDERRQFYVQAPIHIFSSNGPHGRAVGNVLKGIDKWL